MKARELIKALSNVDPDLDVLIYNYTYLEIHGVKVEEVDLAEYADNIEDDPPPDLPPFPVVVALLDVEMLVLEVIGDDEDGGDGE